MLPMPTPINHLIMARELVESGLLTAAAQELLDGQPGAFLLGHTAPDVQTVSGQPREATHFYRFPPSSEQLAYSVLLAAYPELAHPAQMAPDHAAFLCGYLAHLLADELWWHQVFDPCFGTMATWGTWRERLFLHNVLRTYLDRQDQARLNGQIGAALTNATPRRWLPFVSDDALCAWRDLLVQQLQPGQHIHTAEVFAARMGVPAQWIEDTLRDPHEMARLFHHAPPSLLEAYRETVKRQSATLVNQYIGEER